MPIFPHNTHKQKKHPNPTHCRLRLRREPYAQRGSLPHHHPAVNINKSLTGCLPFHLFDIPPILIIICTLLFFQCAANNCKLERFLRKEASALPRLHLTGRGKNLSTPAVLAGMPVRVLASSARTDPVVPAVHQNCAVLHLVRVRVDSLWHQP